MVKVNVKTKVICTIQPKPIGSVEYFQEVMVQNIFSSHAKAQCWKAISKTDALAQKPSRHTQQRSNAHRPEMPSFNS